ncbi:MAG: 3-deoxy-D-manno-octulosonic acid transferase [Desulfobulbus propionicus]|nr:MAG: 3-deoxy-D-manno-octulosonic acid transferase [Desulfobulbus propionicus]
MQIAVFLVLYNLLFICGVILLAPALVSVVLIKEKYRSRIFRRLGFGLPAIPKKGAHRETTIWIHALSVGEVTSSLPLLKGIRAQYPHARIILSVTTSSGQSIAHERGSASVDHIIAAPLDSYFSVKRYIQTLQPDFFILVETDFWPNWLFLLKRYNIPALLVNGRFSAASFTNYSRFRWFFTPLFNSFTALSMQTADDREHMLSLGIRADKVSTLGNLKLDALILSPKTPSTRSALRAAYNILPHQPVWICGSTHDGEEVSILEAYAALKQRIPDALLIIAPRDIHRGKELLLLAGNYQHKSCAKSTMSPGATCDVLILDTLGELSRLYAMGDIAFIGGSMVAQGGHNPVEPAAFGVPVLFGPHMEDFSEIAEELTKAEGAFQIHSAKQMYDIVYALLSDAARREQAGTKAKKWVQKSQGVVARHLELIQHIM